MPRTLQFGHAHRARTVAAAALVAAASIAALVPAPLTVPRALAAHSTAPCIPAGHGPSAIASIAFGRKGGNIRPMRISIYGDGTISYAGGAPISQSYTILPAAVQGLQRLAAAEGFNSWPSQIKSSRLFPDSASLFVTIRYGCSTSTRTVTLQPGAQSPAFSELYDTLLAATAQSS